jgi:hypothetical protein
MNGYPDDSLQQDLPSTVRKCRNWTVGDGTISVSLAFDLDFNVVSIIVFRTVGPSPAKGLADPGQYASVGQERQPSWRPGERRTNASADTDPECAGKPTA